VRILPLIALAALTLVAGPAAIADDHPPGQDGAALVIGEGAYKAAGSAVGAVDDARAVAGALTGAGWRVREAEDLDQAGLTREITAFAAQLKPVEPAFVYFSGLAAKAPSAKSGEGVENFLLPIDADVPDREALPAAAVPLSDILAALTRAGAGAEVVVIDAARPNTLEPHWSAALGLTEPTTATLANAYVAFPAGFGRMAREGLFGAELATAIRDGSGSVNEMFLGLSTRIDQATGGAQVPWSSGSGVSSRLAIRRNVLPAAAGGASPRALYDQAVACGTEACLTEAAGEIDDPTLKIDLELRANVAGVEDVTRPSPPPQLAGAPAAAPPPAPHPPSYVDAFIEANKRTAAGLGLIGWNYFTGSGGFPKNQGQAYIWIMRAASQGDPRANRILGLSFDQGGPLWPRVDKYGAAGYFRKAAEGGDPDGEYWLGVYYYHGDGGVPADPAQAAQWMAKAAAAGQADAQAVIAGKKTP
jgi:TPR repeat protein